LTSAPFSRRSLERSLCPRVNENVGFGLPPERLAGWQVSAASRWTMSQHRAILSYEALMPIFLHFST
jgi:hypothetical protein